MFAPYNIFFILLSYLLLLFGIAWVAERQERRGRSLVNNPYVYSRSLAVYCTSWTFYGSVGRAATSGLSFLTIYLGPTLMAALWMVVLARIVRIAKANHITTISDFHGFRYGKSLLLSGLVAAIAVIGVIPYIGLQIKAIISTFEIISHERISRSVRSLADFARISTSHKVASDIREIFHRTAELVKYDKRFRRIRYQAGFEAIPPPAGESGPDRAGVSQSAAQRARRDAGRGRSAGHDAPTGVGGCRPGRGHRPRLRLRGD